MRWKLLLSFVFLLMLVWLWPNIVHEPLHLFALNAQGLNGKITMDFSFPPRPFTELVGAGPSGVAGGLFFLLLPSLFSLAILGLCWLTRKQASLFTHVILPVYLTFDLLINIGKNSLPTSDFRFLQALPLSVTLLLLGTIFLYGMFITYTGLRRAASLAHSLG
jgi:hypothetical protein